MSGSPGDQKDERRGRKGVIDLDVFGGGVRVRVRVRGRVSQRGTYCSGKRMRDCERRRGCTAWMTLQPTGLQACSRQRQRIPCKSGILGLASLCPASGFSPSTRGPGRLNVCALRELMNTYVSTPLHTPSPLPSSIHPFSHTNKIIQQLSSLLHNTQNPKKDSPSYFPPRHHNSCLHPLTVLRA